MAPFLAEPSTNNGTDGILETATFVPQQDLADSLVPDPASQSTAGEWVYPYPTDFKLTEKPIDEYRELEVMTSPTELSHIWKFLLNSIRLPCLEQVLRVCSRAYFCQSKFLV